MTNFEIALSAAAKVSGLTPKSILARCRKAHVVEARWIVVQVLKNDGYTDALIADFLHRQRVTISHARHVSDDFLKYSKTFQEKLKKANELYAEGKSLRASQA